MSKTIEDVLSNKRRQMDLIAADISVLEAAIKIMEVANIIMPHPGDVLVQSDSTSATLPKRWP